MSWLADALLGSPIPPPNWLDPRYRGSGWRSPTGARVPRGWRPPSYRVSGRDIADQLDERNASVNPPVVQGWAWCLAVTLIVVTMAGLFTLKSDSGDLVGILFVICPLPAWLIAVAVGAFFSHDIEQRDGSVLVRRWTDVWLGRRGRLVGTRRGTHAVLSCGSHVQLEGDAGAVSVSMAMWPSSSRMDLQRRLDAWGIELEFPGAHHAQHPRHWHHGRHRLAHPMPKDRRRERLG